MKYCCAKWSTLAALFVVFSGSLLAQEVVHAVAGKVLSVNPTTQTFSIQTHDGSTELFQCASKSGMRIDFDKALRSNTTSPADLKQSGDHVVVYYYGYGRQQTAVAVKDFGQAALGYTSGKLVHADRKKHTLTIKAADGTSATYEIAEDAGADTAGGVVDGMKYGGSKGNQVIVRYTEDNGSRIAHLVRED
jgi:hypothetical protein